MSNTAIIFDIQRASTVDGPGVRTTVFFKGCNLRCKWCHNPESQSACREMMIYKSKCTGCGICAAKCPFGCALPFDADKCTLCGKCELFCPVDARKICGKEMTADEIYDIVKKDRAFYDNSGGGVTFSGGECMLQLRFLEEILKKCHENGIGTAVDTAGNVPWESFERILPYTDMFLYDIKCISEQLHIDGTGVSNSRIIENFKKLCAAGAKLIVRVPVIPNFNADTEEIKKIADLIKESGGDVTVELLPYHRMGEHKYDALNMSGEIYDVPSPEHMQELRGILGLNTR